MKTMMENRHTAKRSHTHDAIDAWLAFDAGRCWKKMSAWKMPNLMKAKPDESLEDGKMKAKPPDRVCWRIDI